MNILHVEQVVFAVALLFPLEGAGQEPVYMHMPEEDHFPASKCREVSGLSPLVTYCSRIMLSEQASDALF